MKQRQQNKPNKQKKLNKQDKIKKINSIIKKLCFCVALTFISLIYFAYYGDGDIFNFVSLVILIVVIINAWELKNEKEI